MNKRKVCIVIPMQQHSFQTAIGLIKHNKLDRYYTTVYYKKNSKLLNVFIKILPHNLSEGLKGRRNELIDDYAVSNHLLMGMLIQYIGRYPIFSGVSKYIRYKLFRYFADSVSNDIKKREVNIVWTFDSWSIEFYKSLEKKHIPVVKILDMASTSVLVIQRIIKEEQKKNLPFNQSYDDKMEIYGDDQVELYKQEFDYADYFLSPSDWVKRSLIESGISESRILYLPHGVDVKKFTPKPDSYKPNQKLIFLFVGRVEAAKGIAYLFEAFKELNEEDIELQVVGNTYTWEDEAKSYSPNIKIMGVRGCEDMPFMYANADVFILSSLWEGSALSMLEAMSSGLPVIASSHSCAPDVITEGVEGFVYDPYDVNALKSHIKWYTMNKDKIPQMGRNARKKAEKYTWENYYNNVNDIIDTICKRHVFPTS